MIRARIRRVGWVLLVLSCLPLYSLLRYQVWEAEALRSRPENLRAWEDLSARGRILDRQARPLATTVEGERRQPLGRATATLLGYVTPKLGSGGLEALLDSSLRARSAPGTLEEALLLWGRGGRRGEDVVLTLDADLQARAWASLEGRAGAAALLDLDSGGLLAVASAPSFDPGQVEEDWPVLGRDPGAPLVERVTQGLYPPGSTFKALIMAAALGEGVATLSERFSCPGGIEVGGFHLPDSRAHGELILEEALAVSCNVTFAELGRRLGPARIGAWMERLGLGEPPSGVPGAARVHAPEVERPASAALEVGIGQGDLLVSPLSMVRLAGILARGGLDVEPTLVKARLLGGRALWQAEPVSARRVLPQEVALAVASGMRRAVLEGTAIEAGVEGLEVAGKTGTAENPQGAPHAWFIGFAPASRPRIAVAVIVENGGGGGAVAAPLAGRLLRAALAPP